MAVPAIDAEFSFKHLTDHIPTWISSMNALSEYAFQKQQEFVADYAKAVKTLRPGHRKTPSLASIHSDDDQPLQVPQGTESADKKTPTLPNLVDFNPLEAGNKYLYAQQRRKRKPGSSMRSGASGPQKFRSKQAVIIYYDSYLQQELDTMVKSVGVARNHLRKGKLSLNISKGLQLPSLGRRNNVALTSSSYESLRRASQAKNYTCVGTSVGKPNLTSQESQPSTDEAALTKADKELEFMQNLCEKAAHQFLRDGDCNIELKGATEKLQLVLNLATETLPRLKAKEEVSEVPIKDADKPAEIEIALPDFALSSIPKAPAIHDTIAEMNARPILPAAPKSVPVAVITTPAVLDIEVDDDSDQEDIDIDITKFRMASRGGIHA